MFKPSLLLAVVLGTSISSSAAPTVSIMQTAVDRITAYENMVIAANWLDGLNDMAIAFQTVSNISDSLLATFTATDVPVASQWDAVQQCLSQSITAASSDAQALGTLSTSFAKVLIPSMVQSMLSQSMKVDLASATLTTFNETTLLSSSAFANCINTAISAVSSFDSFYASTGFTNSEIVQDVLSNFGNDVDRLDIITANIESIAEQLTNFGFSSAPAFAALGDSTAFVTNAAIFSSDVASELTSNTQNLTGTKANLSQQQSNTQVISSSMPAPALTVALLDSFVFNLRLAALAAGAFSDILDSLQLDAESILTWVQNDASAGLNDAPTLMQAFSQMGTTTYDALSSNLTAVNFGTA